MSAEPETTTYRGESLEELLPQIREELGADAIIVRQREGIVGGVGGFFGKKCVEVEARAAAPVQPIVSPRAVLNAYDTGDEPAPREPLLETLMLQTSPFVEQLEDALAREPEPVVAPSPPPVFEMPTRPAPTPVRMRTPDTDEVRSVLEALENAGILAATAKDIMAEVDRTLRPFEPLASRRELARRVLARRLKVAHTSAAKRRTIALIGPPGAGRTLATAKLAHAHARAGRTVTALSLEPVRKVHRLNELTAKAGVGLEVADTVEKAGLVSKQLRVSDIVVVDTPAIADPLDADQIQETLSLLNAVHPDETHVLLAAGSNLMAVRAYMSALTQHIKPSRIFITHNDLRAHTGVPVGMSLTEKIPVSFIGDGTSATTGLVPAEPDPLARMVLA